MPDQPTLPDGRPITDEMAADHAEHQSEAGYPPNPNCPVCARAIELGLLSR